MYVWQNAKRLPDVSLGECFWECKFWDETAESTERTHVEGTGTKQIHLFRLFCCSEPQSQTFFGPLSLKNFKNLLKPWTCSKIIWWGTELIKLLKSPSNQLNQTLLLKWLRKHSQSFVCRFNFCILLSNAISFFQQGTLPEFSAPSYIGYHHIYSHTASTFVPAHRIVLDVWKFRRKKCHKSTKTKYIIFCSCGRHRLCLRDSFLLSLFILSFYSVSLIIK